MSPALATGESLRKRTHHGASRGGRGHRAIAAAFAAAYACHAWAGASYGAEAVDLALILAVDVSESVDKREAAAQRRGYVDAIKAPDVVETILSGRRGRIAMTYVEWAGPDHLFVILDWAIIDSLASANEFAARLDRQEITQGYTTSITSLLRQTPAIFSRLPFEADRRVIDISGDGPNNDGGYVLHARDRLIEAGVTINGLPILNDRPAPSGYPRLEDLSGYFEHCVVGGVGSFQISAETFQDFATAIRLKMVQEIAGRFEPARQARVYLAAATPGYDCTIGEQQSRKRILDKFESTGSEPNGRVQ